MTAFTIGDLTVTPLVLGEIDDTPRDWFARPTCAVPPGRVRLPVNCLHVSGPGFSVLIDVCDPALYPVAGAGGPDLPTALARRGIAREAVTHVILTHGHHDHFCGVWDREDDRPRFPQATHFLSPRDWDSDSLTRAAQVADGEAADARALEAIFGIGLLNLEEDPACLPQGVTLLGAPGETDGHRCVSISSKGESFFFLADLFHLPAELRSPDLCPTWTDSKMLQRHRVQIADMITAKNARFMCSHIAGILHINAL